MGLFRTRADQKLIHAVRKWAAAKTKNGNPLQPHDSISELEVVIDGRPVTCYIRKLFHQGNVGIQIRRSQETREVVAIVVLNKTTGKFIRTV